MESNYQIAWVVVLAAALVGAVCLWFLLRAVRSLTIKVLLITVAVLFFVTPTPVPDSPAVLAPAFIVAAFEAWFQIDGQPADALLALGISLGGGILIAATACFLIGRRRNQAVAASEPEAG